MVFGVHKMYPYNHKMKGCRIVSLNLYTRVADSYFAKAEVVETVLSVGMHFIGRLRDD